MGTKEEKKSDGRRRGVKGQDLSQILDVADPTTSSFRLDESLIS